MTCQYHHLESDTSYYREQMEVEVGDDDRDNRAKGSAIEGERKRSQYRALRDTSVKSAGFGQRFSNNHKEHTPLVNDTSVTCFDLDIVKLDTLMLNSRKWRKLLVNGDMLHHQV